jgi:hypothetical protein
VKEAFLSCLALLSDDEILSFWRFYLDGVEINPVEENLFKRTMLSIEQYPSLISQFERAYILESRRRSATD